MSATGDDTAGGSEEILSSKKKCTSCEQNIVNDITEGIDSVAIQKNMSTCACCGKDGNSNDMNMCNKCKMVKYCNAACKKKHRKKHKKACERRVAELHEEQLFKDHPPNEECPLCFLPRPHESSKSNFKTCCGKVICIGCIYAMKISGGKDLCAFCRTPPSSSDEEQIKRINKLMNNGNGKAFDMFGGWYDDGMRGLPLDHQRAKELYLKAGELGSAKGYYNLAISYSEGLGAEVDKKKAKHYYELAAMGGHVLARHNLGILEYQAGNVERAFKHWAIEARAGMKESLVPVKIGFTNGMITKDRYAIILRSYHQRQKEMTSDQRDKAVASGLFRDNG